MNARGKDHLLGKGDGEESYVISDGTRFGLIAAGGVALAALVGFGSWLAIRHLDSAGSADRRSHVGAKSYRQTIAENLRVTRHGIRGVDFIKCGSCRVEKRKKGFLTLGGMNVLVLEDLSVVLPRMEPELKSPDRNGSDARSIVRRMGVSDGFLKERGLPMRFSGLKISNLSVSRLSEANTAEPALSARSAEAVRGGLRLSGCMVHNADGAIAVRGAMLTHADKKLRLVWSGGKMDLN